MLLDAGCSGGTALIILACLSNCTGVGCDIDGNRIELANIHSKSIMEKKTFDQDVKVAFELNNITTFQNLNGITVLYMYDCAWNKSDLGLVVLAVNTSRSLRCFISSMDLDFYRSKGLNEEWDIEDVILIRQIGAKCQRILHIYTKTSETNMNDNIIIDDCIANLVNRASNEVLRKQYVDAACETWLKSKDYIRRVSIPHDKDHCIKQSVKLFNLLQNKTYCLNGSVSRFYGEESLTDCTVTNKAKYR